MELDLKSATELIRHRRTIHPEKFSSADVDRSVIEEILTNATWAPTHGMTQPWRFVVYMHEGRNGLVQTVDRLYRAHTPEDEFIQAKLERLQSRVGASPVIIAMAMRRTPDTKIPELEEFEAVACAGQNILLSATAAGLGAFWSSPKFIYAPEASEAFGFEQGDQMVGLIYIGHPQGDWPKSRRKPMEEVTKWIAGEV